MSSNFSEPLTVPRDFVELVALPNSFWSFSSIIYDGKIICRCSKALKKVNYGNF